MGSRCCPLRGQVMNQSVKLRYRRLKRNGWARRRDVSEETSHLWMRNNSIKTTGQRRTDHMVFAPPWHESTVVGSIQCPRKVVDNIHSHCMGCLLGNKWRLQSRSATLVVFSTESFRGGQILEPIRVENCYKTRPWMHRSVRPCFTS